MVALSLAGAGEAAGQTQLLPSLFPEGVPGFDAAPGVTVQSRLHPELTPQGVRAGAFRFSPTLDETMGYDSNVLGNAATAGPRGSWQLTTAPSLSVGSDWSRNQVGASVNLQSTQYLSLPGQNQTNGSAAAGARLDVGRDQALLAIGYAAQHEMLSGINAIASTRPVSFQIGDLRAAYTAVGGRWNLTPALELASWSFGNAVIAGQPTSQAYRDRIVGQGSMTLRYELAPLRNLLFVVRALSQNYTSIPVGQPTSNSQSYQALAGIDYDDNDLWRLRLLLGGESRQFAAPVYQPQNTMIVESELTWFLSGMTTVHATVTRDTQDAAQEGVSGLIYSAARFGIDHELLRNLLLRGYGGVQQAAYFGGGRQTGVVGGVGLVWSLNRVARLSLTYDQSDLRGGQTSAQTLSTGYDRGLSLLTIHLGL